MSDILEIWIENFNNSGLSLEEEIKDVKGTIENEKIWLSSCSEEEMYIYKENIELLEEYIEWLNEELNKGENNNMQSTTINNVTINNVSVKENDMALSIRDYAENVAKAIEEKIDGIETNVVVVTKNNNGIYTGITIKTVGSNIAPTLYVNDFYSNGTSINECADVIVNKYKSLDKNDIPDIDLKLFEDFDNVKDKVIMCLVNGKLNEGTDAVHFPFLDLQIIFKIAYNIEKGMYIKITNSLMEMWKTTAEELLDLAKKNSSRMLPYKYNSIIDVMAESMGIDKEEMAMFGIESFEGMPNVLTNNIEINGSSAILYDGVLKEISKGKDLIIIPSSIHETLIMEFNDTNNKSDDLKEMIQCVNADEVAPDEVLSDHAYRYLAKEDRIVIL